MTYRINKERHPEEDYGREETGDNYQASTHFEAEGDFTERHPYDYGHYPPAPMMPMMMIPVPYMPGYPGMHHSRARHHQTYDE